VGVQKIVVLRAHEWLAEAAATGNFAVAAQQLEAYKLERAQFEPKAPVRMPGEDTFMLDAVASDELTDDDVEDVFNEAFGDDVVGVFSNPQIQPVAVVNPSQHVGDHTDVESALNLTSLKNAGDEGRGVKIAIVDSGVDGTQVSVVGGWSNKPGVAPGQGAPGSHGTMCALDALIAAPQAQIHDYPLLQSVGGHWVAFLSDAIRFFSEIMIQQLQLPGPMVVNNSWALFDRSSDAPHGHQQNYWGNPSHPFNTITSAVVAAGADVLFAAGNCGSPGPDSRCGARDVGGGQSIHGANSHPDVISVAAVTINDDRLAYSSQGPGSLTHDKPDLAAFSHFRYTSKNPDFHTGTSAASPVAAGVVAALRSKSSARNMPPADIKQALLDNARDVGNTNGWGPDYGCGVIDASAAWAAV
jgi:subtilisin family serine protease